MRQTPYWMKLTLFCAGVYNIIWGTIVVLYPIPLFEFAGMEPPRYPELFQCIGMMVAVYGAANLAAASDPIRHWPVVFAGLLGRVLGPAGFLYGLYRGVFTPAAGWTIVTNDLIWIAPFALILWSAAKNGLAADHPPLQADSR